MLKEDYYYRNRRVRNIQMAMVLLIYLFVFYLVNVIAYQLKSRPSYLVRRVQPSTNQGFQFFV
jgi:hypothetical protein